MTHSESNSNTSDINVKLLVKDMYKQHSIDIVLIRCIIMPRQRDIHNKLYE